MTSTAPAASAPATTNQLSGALVGAAVGSACAIDAIFGVSANVIVAAGVVAFAVAALVAGMVLSGVYAMRANVPARSICPSIAVSVDLDGRIYHAPFSYIPIKYA